MRLLGRNCSKLSSLWCLGLLAGLAWGSSGCIFQDGLNVRDVPNENQANESQAVGSGTGQTQGVNSARPNPGDNAQTLSQINSFLDTWHNAAAIADEDTYFGSMTEKGVFIGTDKNENWTRQEFKDAFMQKLFVERDSAWTYIPQSRNVVIAESGKLAWFDEKLRHDNKDGFHMRGSGVVVQQADGSWKIAHYVMSLPLPNEVFDDVLKIIRDFETGKGKDGTQSGTGSSTQGTSSSQSEETSSTQSEQSSSSNNSSSPSSTQDSSTSAT